MLFEGIADWRTELVNLTTQRRHFSTEGTEGNEGRGREETSVRGDVYRMVDQSAQHLVSSHVGLHASLHR